MDIIPNEACTIQKLEPEWYNPYVARVDMLRLDMLHPVISGNKWFKLKYNMAHAQEQGYSSILTFGGAYSNHLIAAAAGAKAYGITATAIVRGLHAKDELTPTLQACRDYGMELHFVSREDYNKKEDVAWLDELSVRYDHPFIIPEGGANKWGRAGVGDIASQIPANYTHICVSIGSGTTMAGLRNALNSDKIVLGYAPMKGGTYLADEVAAVVDADKNSHMQVFDNWHFGGFGKWNEDLLHFMNDFHSQHAIPLDVVYTAKMMYGIEEQILSGYFPPDAAILCIHTGGLQGNATVKGKLIY